VCVCVCVCVCVVSGIICIEQKLIHLKHDIKRGMSK